MQSIFFRLEFYNENDNFGKVMQDKLHTPLGPQLTLSTRMWMPLLRYDLNTFYFSLFLDFTLFNLLFLSNLIFNKHITKKDIVILVFYVHVCDTTSPYRSNNIVLEDKVLRGVMSSFLQLEWISSVFLFWIHVV